MIVLIAAARCEQAIRHWTGSQKAKQHALPSGGRARPFLLLSAFERSILP